MGADDWQESRAELFPADTRAGQNARVIMFIVLTTLSVGGIAIMDFSPSNGMYYWLATAVIFAITNIAMARGAKSDDPASPRLGRGVMHWCALLVTILLVFMLEKSGHIDPANAGLIALLVLALATLLAGIHFDWHFAALGLVLLLTFVLAMLAERFFWIMLFPVVIAVGAVLVRKSPPGASA